MIGASRCVAFAVRTLMPLALAMLTTSCEKSSPFVPKPAPNLDIVDWPYDFSSDGKYLIYRHRPARDRIGGVYMLATAKDSTPTLLFADSLPYFASECRFSPDRSKIAYVRDFLSDIYVLDLGSGTDTRVTFTNGNARAPDWDPSGRYIVYMRVFLDFGMPDSTAGLHIVDTETFTDLSLRAQGIPIFGSNPRWSPDGSLIAYSVQTRITAADSPTPNHVHVARTDGAGKTDITPGDLHNNEFPDWISGGAEIIFESSYVSHVTQIIGRDGSGRRVAPVDIRPYVFYAAVSPATGQCVYTGPDSASVYGVVLLRSLNDPQGLTTRQLTTYDPPESYSASSEPHVASSRH